MFIYIDAALCCCEITYTRKHLFSFDSVDYETSVNYGHSVFVMIVMSFNTYSKQKLIETMEIKMCRTWKQIVSIVSNRTHFMKASYEILFSILSLTLRLSLSLSLSLSLTLYAWRHWILSKILQNLLDSISLGLKFISMHIHCTVFVYMYIFVLICVIVYGDSQPYLRKYANEVRARSLNIPFFIVYNDCREIFNMER